MGLWEPKSCCCCISPRTGTLVMGILGVIGSIIQIIASIRMVASADELRRMCQDRNPYAENLDDCINGAAKGIYVGIAIEFVWLAVAALLIYGTHKRRASFFLPYMILQTICLVVGTIAAIIGVIILFVFGLWLFALVLLFIGGPCIFLVTYFLLVVRVHYKEIKEGVPSGDTEIGSRPMYNKA